MEGRKRILLFFKVLLRKYPRLEFNVKEIIVEADKVCVVWTNHGKDRKSTPYRNHGVTFIRLSEGKIVFISDYFKDTSFV